MTAADHANTVRVVLPSKGSPQVHVVALTEEWGDAHAALDALEAQAKAAANFKTCPFCACSYELPDGWLHDSCPGCKFAEAAEAERDQALLDARDYLAHIHRLGAERDGLADALRRVQEKQPDTLAWLRANNIVFDGPLGTNPASWENVAFSIYTDLCETEAIARAALALTEQS